MLSKDKTLNCDQAMLILNALPHVGPILLRRLMESFGGDPLAILAASESRLHQVEGVGDKVAEAIRHWEHYFDLEREEALLRKSGGVFLHRGMDGYPSLLREIYDPPIGLYTLGPLQVGEQTVAIVGSRRTTLYGQETAYKLAYDLARLGFCVVSGLARGIDTAAHRGALDAKGATMAVLGGGLDVIYPPENLDLFQQIRDRGVLVSEFPFGTRVSKTSFPMRNRVVSGVSRAVIVVESDERGGSMITAQFAADQGRMVFAVPGRIDQVSSRGCHKLIREGAILLRSVEDLLEELSFGSGAQLGFDRREMTHSGTGAEEVRFKTVSLNDDELQVYRILQESGACRLEELIRKTGMDASTLSGVLVMLELKKCAVKRLDGSYEAKSVR